MRNTTFITTKNGTHLYMVSEVQKERDQMDVFTYGTSVFLPAKEPMVSENTRMSYQYTLEKHVYPVIGDCLLIDVTPLMLRSLLADFQRSGMAHTSAVKLHAILRGFFDMAYKDGLIPKSPMDIVERPRATYKEKCMEDSEKAYTAEELALVLQCLEKEPLKWRVYIQLMADTGCRRGELCGLHWEDIDFKNAVITVRHNLQYTTAKGIYDSAPKNRHFRRVDIGPDVLSLLQELKAEQDRDIPSDWVFTRNRSAEPMFPQTPSRYFKEIAKKYDFKDFRPHKLRHTSASIAITNGADVVSVSRRLGHTDPSVTLRMYTHANEDSIRRAGETVRNALKEAANSQATV